VTFAPTFPFTKKNAAIRIASNDPKKPTLDVNLLGRTPLGQPTISNLHYSPDSAYASTTPMTFYGNITFLDHDGDLSSVTLTIVNSSGATVSTITTPIEGASGVAQGTLEGWITATVSIADNYTLQVYVTDVRGFQSQVLSGPVRIAAYPWSSKEASTIARGYAAVAALEGRLYLLGGIRTDAGVTPGPVTSEVEVYDPQTNTWSGAPSMPTARMGLVTAVVDGKLYAIGGATDGWGLEVVGTVEEFDPVAQTWTPRSSMPTPRSFAAGAQIEGRIFVVGGARYDHGVMNSAEAYDPSTDSWSTVAPLPTARAELAAVESDGRLYAVGGYAGLEQRWVGAVEAYDPAINVWSTCVSMPSARSQLALAAVDGEVFAAGGENFNRALDIAESYDTSTDAWSLKTPSPVLFTRTAAGVVNGKVYVLGNSLALEYDPANDIR
jgi:N-acetylneuraminic acid mutarotase